MGTITENLNFEAKRFLASGVRAGNLGPSAIACSTQLFVHSVVMDFSISSHEIDGELRPHFQ